MPVTNLTPVAGWDDVRQLETIDDALAGPGGILNLQAQALLDRTEFLRAAMAGFEGVTNILSSAGATPTLTASQCKRMYVNLVVDSAAYLNATMPTVAAMGIGSSINIGRQDTATSTRPASILMPGADKIIDHNGIQITQMFLHRNERVVLVAAKANTWQMSVMDGCYYDVGDQMYSYTIKPGSIKRDGSLYNRSDYPRLWAFISANVALQISEASWSANRGLFSTGDGAATFRVPDDRGYFDRALDLGAGVDADRVGAGDGSKVGSRQNDEQAAHTHTFTGTAHTHTFTGTAHTHTFTGTAHDHASVNSLADTSLNDVGGAVRLVMGDTGNEPAGTLDSRTGQSTAGGSNSNTTAGGSNSSDTAGGSNSNTTAGGSNSSTGGTETRPKNVGKIPLIIY